MKPKWIATGVILTFKRVVVPSLEIDVKALVMVLIKVVDHGRRFYFPGNSISDCVS